MKKCLLLIFACCCCCNATFCQQRKIDSLEQILKNIKEDTNKVNILNALCFEIINTANYSKAKEYAIQALSISEKIKFQKGVADANNNIGTIYLYQGEFENALKNYFNCLKIKEENLDSQGIASVYGNIGMIYLEQGNLLEALNYQMMDLKIAEKIGNKMLMSNAYNTIGNIYGSRGDYPEALKKFFAALKINSEIGNKKNMATQYNNIGIIFYNQGNYSDALKNNFKSLKMREEIGDKSGVAGSYLNIGNIYSKQGKLIDALKNYFMTLEIEKEIGEKKGIADAYLCVGNIYEYQMDYMRCLENYFIGMRIYREIGDSLSLAMSYNNIGAIYTKQKKYRDALMCLDEGLSLAKEIGSIEDIKDSYQRFAELDSMQGNFKKAYEYFKMFIKYRDSLVNEDNLVKTVQLKMQYEFDKKEAATKAEQEKKDLFAKAELQQQKTIKNSIIGGTGMLAISALFSFVFYKRRREAVMQNKITDSRLRAINAQIDDHFIFNCMQSIQSFIQKKDLMNADSYLVKFSKLIRKVLDNSTQKEITLADDLEFLENYVELEKLRLDHPLCYKVTISNDVNADEIFIPPLLIQPLIENAIEHGIKTKNEQGEISINIKKTGKELEIDITDNGTGIKEKSESAAGRKSFGIPLTKERLEYLSAVNKIEALYKAENVFDTDGNIIGTRVSLKIPVNSAA